MRVIVTGATSFIGAAVVRRLLLEGCQVIAVVRPNSPNLGYLQENIPEKCRVYLQIIGLDLQDIREMEEMDADVWIHGGWGGSGSENRKNRQLQRQNVEDSLAAVETAVRLGCKKFIFTGSQAEYGMSREWLSEESPCHPVSEYGKAKRDFGIQAEMLCQKLNMDYIHLRIFSVYGPGDHPWTLVQSCLRTWLEDGEISLGGCTQQWNFLYIDDAAEAIVRLTKTGKAGIYNLAGEDTRILQGFVEEMYGLCGKRGGFRYGQRPENAEGAVNLMPCINKIKKAANWQPKISFAEGIQMILEQIKDGDYHDRRIDG